MEKNPVRAHGGGAEEVCGRPGGGGKGGLRVFFLDESGFGLSLPPTYAWARQGEAVRVPRAWGKAGRVNAVAHLERLSREGVRGVVFLDNAPFHRSRAFGEVAGAGAHGGLPAAVQPPSEPCGEHLAAGEGVFDAPAALRGRGGAEGGGGRCHGAAQRTDGAGGVAKSMHEHLA